MGEELLVDEQIDAGAEFIREFNDYVPVSVACWIAPTGTDTIYLYISSDEICDTNIMDAYGEVSRRLRSRHPMRLDPFRIKLVSSSDPVARAAIGIRDHRPLWESTHYRESSIGGMEIKGAYIYPRLPAPANQSP